MARLQSWTKKICLTRLSVKGVSVPVDTQKSHILCLVLHKRYAADAADDAELAVAEMATLWSDTRIVRRVPRQERSCYPPKKEERLIKKL